MQRKGSVIIRDNVWSGGGMVLSGVSAVLVSTEM